MSLDDVFTEEDTRELICSSLPEDVNLQNLVHWLKTPPKFTVLRRNGRGEELLDEIRAFLERVSLAFRAAFHHVKNF